MMPLRVFFPVPDASAGFFPYPHALLSCTRPPGCLPFGLLLLLLSFTGQGRVCRFKAEDANTLSSWRFDGYLFARNTTRFGMPINFYEARATRLCNKPRRNIVTQTTDGSAPVVLSPPPRSNGRVSMSACS